MQGETGVARVVNQAEADIAAAFHAVLQRSPDVARASYARLESIQRAQGLVFRDRLLCTVLRPRFLSESRMADLETISHTLADLFERAGDYLLESNPHLDLVGATEEEREIWAIDPGYPGYTITSRLDSFMVGGEPRFVEYNAESPASIGYCDVLSDIFSDLPSVREWDDRPAMEPFNARAALLESLLRSFTDWGGTDPSIAIIDWQDVGTRRDFELCGDYFREHSIPTVICDPRAFTYTGGVLSYEGQPINLVYRRVLLHELLERRREALPLFQAYADGAICMVNNPRSKLLHKKSLFALLSDASLGLPMNAHEREIVERTIPWTRRLVLGRTAYRDAEYDLLSLIVTHQDRFALKPFDDYGGRGVILGWDCTAEKWQRALESAVDRGYVVQERVPVPEGDFPVMRNGTLQIVPLLVDTDPLLFHGRIGGVLTRVSGSALLNVTAGAGSTTPTFIVKEGAR
jgi:hypothetical protein